MTHRNFVILTTILLVVHVGAGLLLDQFAVTGDGPEYLRMAENLLAGHGFTYDGTNPVVGKPPGFPILVAGYLYVCDGLSGFHLLQLVLLFLAYLSVARLATESFGYIAGALVLTFLVAVDPIRDLASNLMSESLFLALFGTGVLAMHRSLKRSSLFLAIVAGVLFGLATYTRPISLFWPVVALILLVVANRRHLRVASIVVAAHVVVVSPWIVRNYVQFDRFVPMVANWGPMYGMTDEAIWTTHATKGWTGGFQHAEFVSLSGSEFLYNWEPQERLRAATLAGIRSDFNGWIRRCVIQSTRAWTYVPGTKAWEWQRPILYWLGRGVMIVFYVACALGAVYYLKRDPVLDTILIGQAIYSGLMLFPVTVESRYLIPVYVCLMPLAIAGGLNVIERAILRRSLATGTTKS